jgi:hypothetical protein
MAGPGSTAALNTELDINCEAITCQLSTVHLIADQSEEKTFEIVGLWTTEPMGLCNETVKSYDLQ